MEQDFIQKMNLFVYYYLIEQKVIKCLHFMTMPSCPIEQLMDKYMRTRGNTTGHAFINKLADARSTTRPA